MGNNVVTFSRRAEVRERAKEDFQLALTSSTSNRGLIPGGSFCHHDTQCQRLLSYHELPLYFLGHRHQLLSTYYRDRGHKCSSPLQCTLWSSSTYWALWPHPSTTGRCLGAGTRSILASTLPQHLALAPACHTESTWMCACVLLTVLRLFVTQWTVVCQAPLCQARIPVGAIFFLQGICPTQGSNLHPILQVDSFTAKPSGTPKA